MSFKLGCTRVKLNHFKILRNTTHTHMWPHCAQFWVEQRGLIQQLTCDSIRLLTHPLLAPIIDMWNAPETLQCTVMKATYSDKNSTSHWWYTPAVGPMLSLGWFGTISHSLYVYNNSDDNSNNNKKKNNNNKNSKNNNDNNNYNNNNNNHNNNDDYEDDDDNDYNNNDADNDNDDDHDNNNDYNNNNNYNNYNNNNNNYNNIIIIMMMMIIMIMITDNENDNDSNNTTIAITIMITIIIIYQIKNEYCNLQMTLKSFLFSNHSSSLCISINKYTII